MADDEEKKVAAMAVVVRGKQKDCEEDLAMAEPALIAAQEALNTLNKVCHFPLMMHFSHMCMIFLFFVFLC